MIQVRLYGRPDRVSRMGPSPRPVWDRFWPKVAQQGECWIWTAARDARGYGKFTIRRGVPEYAHRLAYMMMIGEIPDGLSLDHLCRNPSCVNPYHLDPVTHAENVRRGEAGRNMGSKTHCPHGHVYDNENTIINSKGRRECRTCSRNRARRRRAESRCK